MSLAGQISDTVTALASTRAARREALSGIRRDTARHLSEARTALERMAAAQHESLTEALRSTRLATAILIGAADEQIDAYRKERLKRADALSRDLSGGADALRNGTRKWIGTQSAMRRKVAADALRRRRRDRAALARDVGALSKQNLSFLAALTSDRQKASAIWAGRNVRPAAPAARPKAAPAVAPEVKQEVKQEVAKAEPVKVEPVKAEAPVPAPVPVRADVAKPEPAKTEPAKAAPVKAAPAKVESAAPGSKPSQKSDKA